MKPPIMIPELEHVPNITYANGSNPSPNVTLTTFLPKWSHNPMNNAWDLFPYLNLSVDNLPKYLQIIWFMFKILLFGLLGIIALSYGFFKLVAIWHLFHEHVILFFTEKYEWIKDKEEAERKAKESKYEPYEGIEIPSLKRQRKRKQKPDNKQRKYFLQRVGQNKKIKLFYYLDPDKSRNRQQKKRNRMINREIEDELAMRQQIYGNLDFTELGSIMEYHDDSDSDSDLELTTGVTNINKRPAVVAFEVPVEVHVESAPTGPVAGSSKQPSDYGAGSISYRTSAVESSAVYSDSISRSLFRTTPERDVDEIETIP